MSTIARDELLLFEPYGTNKEHTCRECKHCYSRPKKDRIQLAHCNKGGSVEADDYACINLFEPKEREL